MKCPHCNQEHPEGTKFCPETGGKMLKACTLNPECPDHGKFILPLDSIFCPSCGYRLMVEYNSGSSDYEGNLEDDDTPLCPECYSDNVTDDGSGYLQYKCEDCGHIWGDEDDDDDDDDTPLCPECYSDNVTDDGSGYLQYKCEDCGHIWGDEDDDDDDDDDTPLCPECYSDNVTDDGSGYLQYKCEDCGHIWGDEDDDDDDDELHRFFPVIGITLGETTIGEAYEQKYRYDKIEYHDLNGNESNNFYQAGCSIVWYKGIQFRKEKADDYITNIYMTCFHPIFQEWKDMGFDWGMSYQEWKNLFIQLGYDIEVIDEPQKRYWEEKDYWYLHAVFTACASDYSIKFKLDFDFGNEGYKQRSKKTLYSISVYSENSSLWDEDN